MRHGREGGRRAVLAKMEKAGVYGGCIFSPRPKELLGEDSNIIKFGEMFTLDFAEESDAILKYVFRWNATRNQVLKMPCASSLAAKVKARVRAGGKFYEKIDWIER